MRISLKLFLALVCCITSFNSFSQNASNRDPDGLFIYNKGVDQATSRIDGFVRFSGNELDYLSYGQRFNYYNGTHNFEIVNSNSTAVATGSFEVDVPVSTTIATIYDVATLDPSADNYIF
ncbi:hypothetical protein [uncultured Polaribacter sp.]|uniref:hypothetical protein n=1 Tax=uncultured Polaribacter sp. TaxID=174711 RepID=UPI00262E9CFE|nr:hypothetical protein [uncultured Polaribacter sp.]